MPAHPTCQQTRSFLMQRFEEVGIRPRTRFGQNFLIDLNLQRLLVDSAQLESDDVVLEVGTGTGSLTAMMASKAAAVVTVEVDRQLFQLSAEHLERFDNVTMLDVDALANKNRMNPLVLEAIDRQLNLSSGRRLKLVSNLPYNIATPILSNLLSLDQPPHTMIATIQKELADRIVAKCGCKSYGALSIWIQSQCRVRIVRTMPPTVFWPRPKVTSAIVSIRLDESKRSRIADRSLFHEFVRSMFFHRRKFLRSELISALKKRLDKLGVDQLMATEGLDPKIRAEQLDIRQMLSLYEAVRGVLTG